MHRRDFLRALAGVSLGTVLSSFPWAPGWSTSGEPEPESSLPCPPASPPGNTSEWSIHATEGVTEGQCWWTTPPSEGHIFLWSDGRGMTRWENGVWSHSEFAFGPQHSIIPLYDREEIEFLDGETTEP